MIRQKERYEPLTNQYYWEISFITFNDLPLSNEQYHEVAKVIEEKMREIESRRRVMGSNNKQSI
jgi:hypothetical protein